MRWMRGWLEAYCCGTGADEDGETLGRHCDDYPVREVIGCDLNEMDQWHQRRKFESTALNPRNHPRGVRHRCLGIDIG